MSPFCSRCLGLTIAEFRAVSLGGGSQDVNHGNDNSLCDVDIIMPLLFNSDVVKF